MSFSSSNRMIVTLSSTSAYAMADYFGAFSDMKSPIRETEEIDDRICNDVQVSFYTREVDATNSGVALFIANRDEEHVRHWVLVFHFPNSGRFVTHEADTIEGKLVWVCNQVPPNKENGSKLYANIAKCRTSPKQLQELAKGIKINNLPYNAALRNCQEWIKLFAEAIGGEVCAYIHNNYETYFEKNPVTAGFLGAAHSYLQASVGLNVKSTFKRIKKKKKVM